jgi:hypothetical protein
LEVINDMLCREHSLLRHPFPVPKRHLPVLTKNRN